MPDNEPLVDQFYDHLTRWYVIRQSVAGVTAWFFVWGTAILVLKATQGTSAPTLLWGAIGLPVAVGLAAWVALRKRPDRSTVRAMLDAKGECGGLLMASAECDLGRWKAKPTSAEMPRLRWQGRRAIGFLAVAVAFVTLGFLVPARSLALKETPLDITRPAEQLAEQIRVLKEEKILDPARAETLKEKLAGVRSDALGRDPAKTLEALDHLKDVVRQAARQAAESGARQSSQLGKVEVAAEAIQKAAPMLKPEDAAELMKELAAMAQKAADEGEGLQELSPELAQALKDGTLSKDQLKELAVAAKSGKENISKTAQKLFDAKLIDGDQLKASQGGKQSGKDGKGKDGKGGKGKDGKSGQDGEGGAEGLAKYLADNAGKKTLKEGLSKQEGNGGVSDDGPGITPLNFGDRSQKNGTKFKEEALTPAELASLKQSQLSGVSKVPPKTDPDAGPPQAGGLTGAAAGGGSANAAPVLPQHKAAVGRYFDRPGK